MEGVGGEGEWNMVKAHYRTSSKGKRYRVKAHKRSTESGNIRKNLRKLKPDKTTIRVGPSPSNNYAELEWKNKS